MALKTADAQHSSLKGAVTAEDILTTPQTPEAVRGDSKMHGIQANATFGSALLYTFNHTIACTVYDIPGPFITAGIATLFERLKGKRQEGWLEKKRKHQERMHGHPHDGHHHTHDHHADNEKPQGFLKEFFQSVKHWTASEMIGDFGAIIPTVAVQHFAPGFMTTLRKGIEPVFGAYFMKSAERAAKQQTNAFGLNADPKKIEARAQAIYEHEMSHMPLAFLWTFFSSAFNLTFQKKVLKVDDSWGRLTAYKAGASVLSTGTVFAIRSLAPTKVHKFENAVNNNIVSPIVLGVGKTMGVDENKIKSSLDNGESAEEWATRIRAENVKQSKTMMKR